MPDHLHIITLNKPSLTHIIKSLNIFCHIPLTCLICFKEFSALPYPLQVLYNVPCAALCGTVVCNTVHTLISTYPSTHISTFQLSIFQHGGLSGCSCHKSLALFVTCTPSVPCLYTPVNIQSHVHPGADPMSVTASTSLVDHSPPA
jgi:hypothetical protein